MISVVVLTRNNEKILDKTLKHLTWCDEIVVVDDGSVDKTRDIAGKYTNHIYNHPLKDDFAAARNFGLSQAKSDWVLFVDSDEIVSEDLKKEILAHISVSDSATQAFRLKRTDFFMGRLLRHGETASVRLVRLVRKGSGKWVRPVHEVWQTAAPVADLNQPLLHYPHPTIGEFLDDINRYSDLNAEHFYKQGVRSDIFQIMAYPAGKFLLNYIFKLGFLDGTAGAVVAIMMSFHSYLTRAKLYFLSRK